jgi:tellurite methyltransferase
VRQFISEMPSVEGLHVLDLGCGEGKNANAFARAGASVVAVDCSTLALRNGQREFTGVKIDWVLSKAETYLLDCEHFDVVVMYGLLHCLPTVTTIASVIEMALRKTRMHGHHIIASFNDGPHDLSAHPNFVPTLASHNFFLRQYSCQQIVSHSSAIIHETHPHNNIPHFHSLTRVVVRKAR